MPNFNQFGNVFQYGDSIKNIDVASNLHIGDVIDTNANTEVVKEETPNLSWDWDIEECDNEAWFWIAVMKNPYAAEPHCYGASISFRGEKALALIERVRDKIGAAATSEIVKIWREHN